MSKRLSARLAVIVATLGAVTLLQGCGEDDDRVFFYSPYLPCIPGVTFGTAGVAFNPSAPASASQDSTSGGLGAASALATSGGGSAQVSGGVGY